MNKNLLSVAVLLFSVLTPARAEDKQKIASKIQKVVVFLKGAQITRTAAVNIAPGTTTLAFTNISPNIDPQSIQVNATGEFTVLSVKNEIDYLDDENKQSRIQALRDQQKQLRDKISLQREFYNIYKEEENMLAKNQVVSGPNVSLDVLKLKAALDFQTARLTDLKKKEQATTLEINRLETEIQKFNKQIIEENKGSDDKASGDILVTISSKEAVQSHFTITYVARDAEWFPTYDIRAKSVTNPITIAYKANVAQHTGEDWNNIKLTLSTGNPSVNNSKPELQPYYLNQNMIYAGQAANLTRVTGRITDAEKGDPLPGVSIRVKGTSIGAVTDVNGNYSIQLPGGQQILTYSYVGYTTQERAAVAQVINVPMQVSQNNLSEVVVVGYGASDKSESGYEVQEKAANIRIRGTTTVPLVVEQAEGQTNVEFNIDNPYTIPTDGKQYLVEIYQTNVPAKFEYYAAPKLSTDVFLTAKLTDWNRYNFLSGEANLFYEGTFIGKSLINSKMTDDTLNLSLGVDKNIVITRTLQKDLSDKQGIFGSTKKESRDWLIDVKNRKSQSVNLLLEDQVPVAQDAAIEVERQEVSGGKVEANSGKVTWTLALKPQDEKKLTLKYQVKYPKNQSVIVQ